MRNASRMGSSNDENDLPLWNKILGWLISLTAFASEASLGKAFFQTALVC